jgi:hypothetical protein
MIIDTLDGGLGRGKIFSERKKGRSQTRGISLSPLSLSSRSPFVLRAVKCNAKQALPCLLRVHTHTRNGTAQQPATQAHLHSPAPASQTAREVESLSILNTKYKQVQL